MSGARDAGPAAAAPPVGPLVDHLFRRESGRIVSVLTRVFGLRNLALAEDVVQETLWEALRQWPFAGIPRNPAGWLFQVARNKALDVLRREQAFQRLAPELAAEAAAGHDALLGAMRSPEAVEDETLRMMFACCHPALTLESQIALTLKVLGGFGVGEIARALLSQESAVERRLGRARQRLREAAVPFEMPGGEALGPRVGAVLSVLYLMFNEGYSGSFAEQPIRRDVCLEAMRLTRLVAERVPGQQPPASALLALMCFHAARFDARLDGDGNLLMLCDQDRGRWDRDLIAEGFGHLERSAGGRQASPFHLEAGIAALHCLAADYASTDWTAILGLYDQLLAVNPSPVVALNRAIALGEVRGPAAALPVLIELGAARELQGYHLLPATLGEMHRRLGDVAAAERHLARALALATSPAEKRYLDRKLATCRGRRTSG